MGGANCEGEMGEQTLESFPWVDCIVSGEADALFPDLCRDLLDQGRDADLGSGWRRLSAPLEKSVSSPFTTTSSTATFCSSTTWTRCRCRIIDHYFQALNASTLTNLHQSGTVSREFTRLLVGREVSLHVLRLERSRNAVSLEITRASTR